jgi:hypothetical protein
MHFIIDLIRKAGFKQNEHRPIISADADVHPNPRLESDGFTAYHLIECGPFGITGPVKLVCDHARLKEPVGVRGVQRIRNGRHALTEAARAREE